MKAYRNYVSENLSRLAARQLHLCGYVLKTFGSGSKGKGATVFLTPESLFLRTGPGGVQIDRKGTQPQRVGLSLFGSRIYADQVYSDNVDKPSTDKICNQFHRTKVPQLEARHTSSGSSSDTGSTIIGTGS
jgi:hypothetical protein